MNGMTLNVCHLYNYAKNGFSTLLNSKHKNYPPGFNTLYASLSALFSLGTFLIPKALLTFLMF